MTLFERNHTAKQYRAIRKILRGNEPYCEEQQMPQSTLLSKVAFFFFILGVMFIGSCQVVHAEIPESQAVKILVGEASNQGFKGMVCVAEVLRHRNSVKGFYGLHASHSAHEPKWVWNMARKAWYASLHTNYTHLADHFENIHAFGCPYWVKNCVKTFTYKDHQFYREI